MTRSARISILVLIALATLAAAATAAPSSAAPTPAKREYAPALQSVGSGGGDFHILRIEQTRGIPAGATVGVVSSGSAALSLFVESDLMAKGFVVRQVDIYGLLTPRERALTDPSDDFAFMNFLIATLGNGDKANSVASIDKLLPADKIDLENQLAEHYIGLYANLKKLISLLNVDYLVVAGPVFKEMSYLIRVYDLNRFDILYSCLFAGDTKQWRNVIGAPQKNMPNVSYSLKAEAEPVAFWEMAFSKFAIDKMKIGSPASEGSGKGKDKDK
jgi:hypothetical protein